MDVFVSFQHARIASELYGFGGPFRTQSGAYNRVFLALVLLCVTISVSGFHIVYSPQQYRCSTCATKVDAVRYVRLKSLVPT